MTRALQRELFDELTVDNFAGGGGASMAIYGHAATATA